MTGFIAAHRGRFGVEPICRVMECSPSTYWAARSRPPSKRALRDAELKPEIRRVFKENYGVYGAHKVWKQLNRERIPVARCTVRRLMRECELRGVRRGRSCRTTVGDESAVRAADLVCRRFAAERPDQLSRRRLHRRRHLVGLLLRGAGDRRVLTHDRRLVTVELAAHRDASGGAGDGALAAGRRAAGPGAPLRPRLPVHLDPLRRASCRSRHRALGGLGRRCLRL